MQLSQDVVAIVGLATAILAATIALKQNDIKKVLAYSTVSQLGYMFLSFGSWRLYYRCCISCNDACFFQSFTISWCRSVIHAMNGEQDITKMGGLRKKLPITFFTFLIGVLAISGFPFTSGFISKDEILIATYAHSHLLFWFAAFAALLTAIYMFRLLMLVFYGGFRGTS